MKYFIFLIFLAACSSKSGQLSDKARELEVYPSKPQDCRVMGRIVGLDKNGSKELALNHVLNQASEMRATGVYVNQEVPNGKLIEVHATAYDCN